MLLTARSRISQGYHLLKQTEFTPGGSTRAGPSMCELALCMAKKAAFPEGILLTWEH